MATTLMTTAPMPGHDYHIHTTTPITTTPMATIPMATTPMPGISTLYTKMANY
ncbi:MAG: hypothetical protein ALECFALPRED_007345 [Alectoria fallacina]|uniref:Uncharacterized protein n=1 Tax=Alectoria fallacina TaxID=1903189 RepID=A0A8H3EZ82_9LECA|nr:MAG: hypothetical protein ALECFALPRED_007345 [Alectoria fallacina]